MAKKPPSLADRRERLPEVGGILHLEHFNCEVLDHDIITTFFMAGLGLTRDPYRRTDHRNMGVNIGSQQFHLPRRGRETPPYHGEIGLVVPEFKAMKARLDQLKRDGKFKGTRYAWKMEGRTPVVTAPWGLKLRLQKAGDRAIPQAPRHELCGCSRGTGAGGADRRIFQPAHGCTGCHAVHQGRADGGGDHGALSICPV